MMEILMPFAACGCVIILVMLGTTAVETAVANRGEAPVGSRRSLETDPFFDRVVVRLFQKATESGRRYTPAGMIEDIEKRLAYAGRRGQAELDRFLAVRVLSLGAAVVFVVFALCTFADLFSIPGINSRYAVIMFVFLAVIVTILPDAKLNKAAQARQKEIRKGFSEFLDILTISVEAGLGFDQAVIRIADTTTGPLADEVLRMNGEMLAGASRSNALLAMEERVGLPEMKSFVMTIVQADRFGVSIADVLRSLSDELRTLRHQQAQEAAQKAPVKMLIPMTFFIFPALFAVVLVPALINIMTNFHA